MTDLNQYLLFETISGSRMYGTHTEHSDVDQRGVVLLPLENLLSLYSKFDVADNSSGKKEDRVLYALDNFFRLSVDANPNILELFFAPDSCYLVSSATWDDVIVPSRDLFVSKKARYTFGNHALSQLKDLRNRREWLTNPPTHAPLRSEFGLPETAMSKSDTKNTLETIDSGFIKDEFLEMFAKEQAYDRAKQKWSNYQKWLVYRNPQRRELESNNGYDTKYASHVFRLIEEGRQLLTTGEIKFPLHNAQYLVDIKNGEYSYEEIEEMAMTELSMFDVWMEQSELPDVANRDAVDQLYYEIVYSMI